MIRQLALLALCSIGIAQVPLDNSDKKGSVEFRVVGPDGRPIHGATLSVCRLINKHYGSSTDVPPTTQLDYGSYKLTVRGSPAYPVDKSLEVKSSFQLVIIGLYPAPIEMPWVGNTIQGKLPPLSEKKGCRWVRLMSPVSETELAEAKAGDKGTFLMENVKPGEYILSTFGDDGLCEVVRAKIQDKMRQTLILR